MKTFLAVLFAGAMLSTAAFSADGDPYREERFKAKYGRYTPAEEARRQAIVQQERATAKQCASYECCSHKRVAQENSKVTGSAWLNLWSQSKWGRTIPAGASLPAEAPAATRAKTVSNDSVAFADAWAQAKWGRSIRRADNRTEVQVASAGRAEAGCPHGSSTCDHPKCCD